MKRAIRILPAVLLLAFVAAAQTPHNVALSWNWSQGTGAAATGFNVKRAPSAGGPYTTVGTVSPTTLAYTDTSGTGNVLTEGATYFYIVTTSGNCRDSNGVVTPCESGPSNEVSALIPFRVVLPPNAPTALQGTAH